MPACILCCDRCGTQQVKPLSDVDFGVLLAEGAARVPCLACNDTTAWKLVLPKRREPRTDQPKPRKLLAIDDDRNTLRMLQMMLRAEDYSVETAASPDEAIHKLQTSNFDVIISDIMMPGFDGRSLYRFLAVYLPAYTDRVVFLTGDQSERTLKFLKECGCPYTFKPIDLRTLQARISEIP